jgi:hypothetical protein
MLDKKITEISGPSAALVVVKYQIRLAGLGASKYPTSSQKSKPKSVEQSEHQFYSARLLE